MNNDPSQQAAVAAPSRALVVPRLAHGVRGVTGNERVKAFSDGVFTITITLLVFSLQVPTVPSAQLAGALSSLWPKVLGYIVSFVILGVYWVAHHNMFMHIRRHDRVLLWLNILFLMFVAAMPFLAGLLVEYPGVQSAVLAYAGTLVFAGLALDLLWWYAAHDYHLVDPQIDPSLVAFVHRRVLLAPLIYLAAMGLSFVSPLWAEVLFVVVPVIYILPGPLDHYHHKELAGE